MIDDPRKGLIIAVLKFLKCEVRSAYRKPDNGVETNLVPWLTICEFVFQENPFFLVNMETMKQLRNPISYLVMFWIASINVFSMTINDLSIKNDSIDCYNL